MVHTNYQFFRESEAFGDEYWLDSQPYRAKWKQEGINEGITHDKVGPGSQREVRFYDKTFIPLVRVLKSL